MASPILPGTGLGSGLDTGAIVKALVNADKAAKQGQIDRGTATNTASISGIGTLKSLMAAFNQAMKDLGSTTTPQFPGFAATSSDVKIVGATASNSAVNGNYVVKVDNLATSSKVTSARVRRRYDQPDHCRYVEHHAGNQHLQPRQSRPGRRCNRFAIRSTPIPRSRAQVSVPTSSPTPSVRVWYLARPRPVRALTFPSAAFRN